jgi:hypothetical protein
VKQTLFLITLISLPLLLGLVKEKQDECLPCKECYDIAWDDGYRLGLATGEIHEKYSIIRTLIKMGKTDKEIFRMATTSNVELKDIKEQLKEYHGYFEFEVTRYELIRTLLKEGKTNEEIVKKAHSSFYELEQVKKRLKQFNGKFKWEVK